MIAYRKERINHAMLFFAQEHHKKTHRYLSQTVLYKYLAFFEFRYLKFYGEMPLELTYRAMFLPGITIRLMPLCKALRNAGLFY
jgi:hypothetical protein